MRTDNIEAKRQMLRERMHALEFYVELSTLLESRVIQMLLKRIEDILDDLRETEW